MFQGVTWFPPVSGYTAVTGRIPDGPQVSGKPLVDWWVAEASVLLEASWLCTGQNVEAVSIPAGDGLLQAKDLPRVLDGHLGDSGLLVRSWSGEGTH